MEEGRREARKGILTCFIITAINNHFYRELMIYLEMQDIYHLNKVINMMLKIIMFRIYIYVIMPC